MGTLPHAVPRTDCPELPASARGSHCATPRGMPNAVSFRRVLAERFQPPFHTHTLPVMRWINHLKMGGRRARQSTAVMLVQLNARYRH